MELNKIYEKVKDDFVEVVFPKSSEFYKSPLFRSSMLTSLKKMGAINLGFKNQFDKEVRALEELTFEDLKFLHTYKKQLETLNKVGKDRFANIITFKFIYFYLRTTKKGETKTVRIVKEIVFKGRD